MTGIERTQMSGVQPALELFKAMPMNWEEFDSEVSLRETLFNIENKILG